MKSSASAPGKLYIAGEYAVVNSGYPAIVLAIDQTITVNLKMNQVGGTIHSTQNSGLTVPWQRKNNRLVVDKRKNPYAYITEAIRITENYLIELGISELHYYDLTVSTRLDDSDSGVKYGLGSSAAVTVATIKALLAFYHVDITPMLLYKLASLVHLEVKSNGSFGDIAASAFGGWIAYACFDRDWVRQAFQEMDLLDLLDAPWPLLRIERLELPIGLDMMVGWTRFAASTTDLVDQLNGRLSDEEKTKAHQTFLANSKSCLDKMIVAFEQGNIPNIQAGIQENRRLLLQFSQDMDIEIETATLKNLCDIAIKHGAVAKSSGAGGGDCGICFIKSDQEEARQAIVNEWEAAGIQVLPFSVAAPFSGLVFNTFHEEETND